MDRFKAVSMSVEDARFRVGLIFGLHFSIVFLLIKIILLRQHSITCHLNLLAFATTEISYHLKFASRVFVLASCNF